jgi:hypothetical protein
MLVELEAKMATDSIDIECVDHAGMCTCRHVSCGLDAYMAWTHTDTHVQIHICACDKGPGGNMSSSSSSNVSHSMLQSP